MGCHKNVGKDKFPKQGEYLGKRCKVIFFYDASSEVMGTVVRDDAEDPWRTFIKLDDGRVVTSTECQYNPTEEEASGKANGRTQDADGRRGDPHQAAVGLSDPGRA